MPLLTVDDYEAAQRIVYAVMPPTPQYAWPLLAARVGAEVWVKHENHTPTGAFKVRGGLVYMERLKRERPQVRGVISATRGNHGQSVAFAAARNGVQAVLLVPHGNSVEKNAAMRAFGAELIEHGHDFDAAREEAARIAPGRGLEMMPSFNMDLVRGVGTYAMELFRAAPDLDTVYAPIGLGSGICGLITARDALGLKTKIVGCVSTNAPAYSLSFAARKVIETNSADTFADGVAVRIPSPDALDIILKGAERIVQVSDAEVEDAMRAYYADTHQLAEGAGAVPLAALMQERERMKGRKVAVILSGGNIDRPVYARIISAAPTPGRS
jgi:threonine dehydratase